MGRRKKPNDSPPKSKGKKRPPPKVVVCPFCQKVGHKSRQSEECGRSFRKPKNAAEPVPGTSTEVQCASCGDYGHRRASYNKCKNRQPRAAQQSTGLSKKDRDTYSIKCGFRSFCKNQLVFDLVNQDVLVISRFLIDSSYLIEYCVRDPKRWLVGEWRTMDAQPDIRSMMMHLTLGYTPTANNRPGRRFYSLFAEYIAMRDVHSGGPLYENIHRGPLYDQACAEFTRNFATNVTTHARVRVRNYLLKIVGMARTDAYDSVDALFDTNARPVIIDEGNPFDDFEDLDFTEIDTKWWKFVGFYQRLQQQMLQPATEEVQQRDTERRAAAEVRRLARAERAREREARNPRKGKSLATATKTKKPKVPAAEAQTCGKGFVLVPVYNLGSKHVVYDSGAVHQLLMRADDASGDKPPFPESPEPVHRIPGAYSNDPLVLWRKCFQIPEKLIREQKFACSVSTNGVDVSIHCARPKPDDEEDATLSKRRKLTTKGKAKTGEFVQRQPLRDHASDYTRMVGIDPGEKIACVGVVRTSDEDTDAVDKRAKNNQQRICLSTAAFRFDSGFYKREKQRVKLTGTVDLARQNLLATERFLGLNTNDPDRYAIVTEYRLRQFKLCQSTYEKRAVTRLHWQKELCTQQTTDRLVNYLSTGEDKQTQKRHARKRRRRGRKKPADGRHSDDGTSGAKAKAKADNDCDLSSDSDFEMRRPKSAKTRKGKGPAAKTVTERPESALPGTSKPSTSFTPTPAERRRATMSSTPSTKRQSESGRGEVKTLIVVGQFNIPKGTKGRPGAPLTKLLKRLNDRAHRGQKDIHIVIADEFRTTINCSQCNRKCTKISTGRDRYLYCAPCGITWNRDVNAGHNILNLGLVRNGLVPDGYMPDADNFSRSRRVAQ